MGQRADEGRRGGAWGLRWAGARPACRTPGHNSACESAVECVSTILRLSKSIDPAGAENLGPRGPFASETCVRRQTQSSPAQMTAVLHLHMHHCIHEYFPARWTGAITDARHRCSLSGGHL